MLPDQSDASLLASLMTKEQRYYSRNRLCVLARAKARYDRSPKVRRRMVATTRKRRALERVADRWLREWRGGKAA